MKSQANPPCRIRALIGFAILLATAPAGAARTVVTLGFDDSTSDQMAARQILDKRGFKGTFYIISGRIGTSGYFTVSDLQSIQAAGHEIAGHTVNHLDLTTFASSQLQHEICDDRGALIGWGFNPVSFAYPYGSYNGAVEAAVKGCGYAGARQVGGLDCSGCLPAETLPPVDPYAAQTPDSIKNYNTLADMQNYVIAAEQSGGGWVPLVMHHVCDACGTYAVSSATLAAFADWLQSRAASGTVVLTAAQAMGAAPQPNPAPSIASLSPSSAAAGGPGFTLSVYGANFISSSTVRWNGSARTTAFISRSTLTASIPSGDIASSGTASVAVFNPGPGGGVSNGAVFIVSGSTVPANPVPSVASLSPSSATAGGPSFLLRVYGANFMSSSTVQWNASARATTFVGVSTLTASIAAGDIAAAGTASLTVFNPGPGGGTSNAVSFTVAAPPPPPNPVPSIASLSPSSATAGGPGLTLSVFGSNFLSTSTVRWNGSTRTTTFVSASTITASILAGDIASSGTASVTVFNPAPGGGVSNAASFTISSAAPSAVLFSDSFNVPDGLITNEYAYWNPVDPASVQSPNWFMTSGSLFASGRQGWTGVPDDVSPNAASSNGTDSVVFELDTKRTDFGNVTVSFSLVNQGLTTAPSTPAQAWDGVEVILRYQDAGTFYYLDANRRDNSVAIKKKSGSTDTFLASGVTYVVPFNSSQNVHAAVSNNPDGSVSLSLSLNGFQLISATDAGTGGAAITKPGGVGIRGANDNFKFGAFTVTSAAGTPAAAWHAPAAPVLSSVRAYPNPWRASLHSAFGLVFDGLARASRVEIYAAAGNRVRVLEASEGKASWSLTDDSGRPVGSGFYFYIATDAKGKKTRGKLVVVR